MNEAKGELRITVWCGGLVVKVLSLQPTGSRSKPCHLYIGLGNQAVLVVLTQYYSKQSTQSRTWPNFLCWLLLEPTNKDDCLLKEKLTLAGQLERFPYLTFRITISDKKIGQPLRTGSSKNVQSLDYGNSSDRIIM